jgi:protein subunit release factor B
MRRFETDVALAEQMEQERKTLKKVLIIFSGSLAVGVMTSLFYAFYTLFYDEE